MDVRCLGVVRVDSLRFHIRRRDGVESDAPEEDGVRRAYPCMGIGSIVLIVAYNFVLHAMQRRVQYRMVGLEYTQTHGPCGMHKGPHVPRAHSHAKLFWATWYTW